MCNRVSCSREAFRLRIASCETIEGPLRYSAEMGKGYAFGNIVPTLFEFLVKALH